LVVRSQEESFDHLSWRGGAKAAILDWLSARAAIGTGFRTPAADELVGRFEQSYAKIIGNPGLKPETSSTYEAGLDAEHRGLGTGLGFFYTDYSDRIAGGFPACVSGDCSWTTYKNVEGAILSGLEGYLKYQIPIPVNDKTIRIIPFVNFIYYTQRRLEDDEYAQSLGSYTVPYVSRANLTGGMHLDFNGKAGLQFTAVYHGPQEVQDWDWMSTTYGKAVDKEGFTVLSTRFNIRPVKHFNVYLAVDNLTDESYSFVNGYPMPGRTFRVGLEARF
jgi:vitamin B12 transporter